VVRRAARCLPQHGRSRPPELGLLGRFTHQYQARAPAGTTIALDITGIGTWTLTRTATGWTLDEGRAASPAASLQMTGEAAWRLLTGACYDTRQVQSSGEPALAEPLLRVRGIIV